jgi:L-threonylcarbamoyladenylate synthase
MSRSRCTRTSRDVLASSRDASKLDELGTAMAALRRGRLVVLPTDTVYGIAALPRSQGGTAELFAVKERPSDKAIPVLGASPADLAEVVDFDDRARAVAGAFWPGPLTVVLRRRAAGPTTSAAPIPLRSRCAFPATR